MNENANATPAMSQNNPHYPDEYATGRVVFFGREFIVTPDVLIPRLETEGLVRRARKILQGRIKRVDSAECRVQTKEHHATHIGGTTLPIVGGDGGGTPPNLPYKERNTIIDIGCGSGIIGTSVADLADKIVFIDISPEALAIAEKNFQKYYPEKKAEFIVSDLLEVVQSAECRVQTDEIKNNFFLAHQPTSPPANLLFLANLPYIKSGDWVHMSPDTRYEPEVALFGGGETGFELYERLFAQVQSLLEKGGAESEGRSGGLVPKNSETPIPLTSFIKGESNQIIHQLTNSLTITLIIEFGFDQREVAEQVIGKYGWKYEFFADYAGVERFCEIDLTYLYIYNS